MRILNSGLQNMMSGFSSSGLGVLQPVLKRSFSSRFTYPSLARRMKSTLAEGSRLSEITEMQKDLMSWKSSLKELNDARYKAFEEGSKTQRWVIGVVFAMMGFGFTVNARATANSEAHVSKLVDKLGDEVDKLGDEVSKETEKLNKKVDSLEGKVDKLTEQVNKVLNLRESRW